MKNQIPNWLLKVEDDGRLEVPSWLLEDLYEIIKSRLVDEVGIKVADNKLGILYDKTAE